MMVFPESLFVYNKLSSKMTSMSIREKYIKTTYHITVFLETREREHNNKSQYSSLRVNSTSNILRSIAMTTHRFFPGLFSFIILVHMIKREENQGKKYFFFEEVK
jgi:hypothetical protein